LVLPHSSIVFLDRREHDKSYLPNDRRAESKSTLVLSFLECFDNLVVVLTLPGTFSFIGAWGFEVWVGCVVLGCARGFDWRWWGGGFVRAGWGGGGVGWGGFGGGWGGWVGGGGGELGGGGGFFVWGFGGAVGFLLGGFGGWGGLASVFFLAGPPPPTPTVKTGAPP